MWGILLFGQRGVKSTATSGRQQFFRDVQNETPIFLLLFFKDKNKASLPFLTN